MKLFPKLLFRCLDIDSEKLQKKYQSESNLILFSLLPLDFIPTFTEIFSLKLDLSPNQFCKSEVAFGTAAKVYDLATQTSELEASSHLAL